MARARSIVAITSYCDTFYKADTWDSQCSDCDQLSRHRHMKSRLLRQIMYLLSAG